jgi:hypothetical protein
MGASPGSRTSTGKEGKRYATRNPGHTAAPEEVAFRNLRAVLLAWGSA